MVHVIKKRFEKKRKLNTTIYFENNLYFYKKRQTKTKFTFEKDPIGEVHYSFKVFHDGITFYIISGDIYSCFFYIGDIRISYVFNPSAYVFWDRNRYCSFVPNKINDLYFERYNGGSVKCYSINITYIGDTRCLNIPVFSSMEIMEYIGKNKLSIFSEKKDRKILHQLKRWRSIQKDENFSYFFVNKWRAKILPILNDFIINPHKEDCSPVVKKYFQINIERYFNEL